MLTLNDVSICDQQVSSVQVATTSYIQSLIQNVYVTEACPHIPLCLRIVYYAALQVLAGDPGVNGMWYVVLSSSKDFT
jgi:hypothetical protein